MTVRMTIPEIITHRQYLLNSVVGIDVGRILIWIITAGYDVSNSNELLLMLVLVDVSVVLQAGVGSTDAVSCWC